MGKRYKKISDVFYLSLVLAKSDFKLRNEGSYLGILWYLLNPLLMFIVLLGIFSKRLGSDISYYPLYLLLGIVIFNFFRQATIEATYVINDSRWIIKSIYFPLEALIIAIVLKTVFSNLFEILLFGIFLMAYGVSLEGLLFYPILVVFLFFFVVGVSFILATFTVFFNDFNNIWNFSIYLIWLGTPIFYAVGDQPQLSFLNLFNPLYYFITVARDLIIYSKIPEGRLIIGAISYSVTFFIFGSIFFNKFKHRFAELI